MWNIQINSVHMYQWSTSFTFFHNDVESTWGCVICNCYKVVAKWMHSNLKEATRVWGLIQKVITWYRFFPGDYSTSASNKNDLLNLFWARVRIRPCGKVTSWSEYLVIIFKNVIFVLLFCYTVKIAKECCHNAGHICTIKREMQERIRT